MDSTSAETECNIILRACNVEDIFQDFDARRAGLLKALTDDVVKFYIQCNPEKENLRLYGLPDESWELKVPEEDCELNDIPAPTIGINFARPDNVQDTNWISLIAIHADSWLLAVAFYYATKSGFDLADRERLYDMINYYPTLFDVVRWRNLVKERSSEGPQMKSGGSEHGDEGEQERRGKIVQESSSMP